MSVMKGAKQQNLESDEEIREEASKTESTMGPQIASIETSTRGRSCRFDVDNKHILFGRGKGVNAHPGNKRMKRILDKYRAEYDESERGEKRALVRRVYHELTSGGTKFLKRIEGREDGWEEVSEEVAVEKVGHSLRCAKYRPPPRSEPHVWNALAAAGNAQNARIHVPQSTIATEGVLPSAIIANSDFARHGNTMGLQNTVRPQHLLGIPLGAASMSTQRIPLPQSTVATNFGVAASSIIGSSPLVPQGHAARLQNALQPQHMLGITAPRITGGLEAPLLGNRAGMPSVLPPRPPSSLDAYLLAVELERSRLRSLLPLTPGSFASSAALNGSVAASQLLATMEQEQQIRQSLLGQSPPPSASQHTEQHSKDSKNSKRK